jgi:hypothetical protein
MIYNYIDESILTDIADAIREVNGKSVKYKPKDMASAIRRIGQKPLYDFATATDEELTEMVNAYYNGIITLDEVKSVWSVGDKRKINLSAMEATGVGESHVAQEQYFTILDFEHDDLVTSASGKTKALITVQQLNVLSNGTTAEDGYMNSTDTNTNGWDGSVRRTWCNNVYYNALPSNIKSLIKQITKQNYKVYNSTTLSTTNDYIFLPSETEIFATKGMSAGNTEGTQYEYYTTSANKIKYKGNTSTIGSAYMWWERSPFSGGTSYFCSVGSGGTANSYYASFAFGLAPAFCI